MKMTQENRFLTHTISTIFPTQKHLNLASRFFMVLFSLITFSVQMGFASQNITLIESNNSLTQNEEETLLKNSQISYRADGGFTNVKSYSVIISCVDGKISTLSSITDPRIKNDIPLHKMGSLNTQSYLALWRNLNRMAVLTKKDAPTPKLDILDEFTINFEARIGTKKHQFNVFGCSRPEASQYFAIRNLIDDAVSMNLLWQNHQELAKK